MDFIYIYKLRRKLLAIVLSGVGRGLRGRDGGGDLTNLQYKSNWNYQNESPLYNEHIIIFKKSF
jgi:hypothetical protein